MTLSARAHEDVDVLILGAGAAGLTAALGFTGARVLVVADQPAGVGGATPLAQGGVAAALGNDDDIQRHGEDTLATGCGLSDEAAVSALAASGRAVIERLSGLGVAFDRDAGGALDLGLEAAHQRRRIVHARDETGAVIAAALASAVAHKNDVELRWGTRVEALATRGGGVAGALIEREGERHVVAARAVVLAMGGLGALYPVSTNPAGALGAGLAYAAEAGAELADLEFVQFHPTALLGAGARRPLLSEALRGAGARLVDSRARPFMSDWHPLADLAPRDVVARALWRRAQRGERSYLDVRQILASGAGDRFPTMLAACRSAALEPGYDLLPVAPAAHYHMGGVATDLDGRTSLAGLWACGEVACTGAHGANRLASNSLLEAVAFGERVARDITSSLSEPGAGRCAFLDSATVEVTLPARGASGTNSERDLEVACTVRHMMGANVGLIRDEPGLAEAVRFLDAAAGDSALTGKTRAMALAAFTVAAAALLRRESRGSHFRTDFPGPSPSGAARARTSLAALRHGVRGALAAPAKSLSALGG